MIFKPRSTDEQQRTPAQDYTEAREILRRLELGQTAQQSNDDLLKWCLSDMTGEERNDDE